MFSRRIFTGALLLGTLLGPVTAAAQEPGGTTATAADLLRSSDARRGSDLAGLAMRSTVTVLRNGVEHNSYTLMVEGNGDSSLITFLEPARSRGTRMLVQGRSMWFKSPGVRKPVPISPRQRLLGGAANGDIATTNYSRDYDAELVGTGEVNGRPVHILNLTAKGRDVTYDRITYHIDQETGLGLKAEFHTVSGKMLKTALFGYGDPIDHQGRPIFFVTRMEIRDVLTPNEITVLTYDGFEIRDIPASRLNLNALRD